jgi:hypothetical protein
MAMAAFSERAERPSLYPLSARAAAASAAAVCSSRRGWFSVNTQRSSGEPGKPTAGAEDSGVFFGSNTTLSVMSAPSPRNTYCRSVGSMMPR